MDATLPLPSWLSSSPAVATPSPSIHDVSCPSPLASDLTTTARAVARALVVVDVPLAKACAHFCDGRAWEDSGHARQSDVSRELLGRSPRWLRQQAALGRALLAMPGLERAMLGADGGAPLGAVAAHAIASVADEDTLAAWIARARAVSVRQVLADVRHARAAARDAAMDESSRPRGMQRAPQGARHWVAITAPEAVHAAFDEVLELHAAVCGSEQTPASLIEALVAEGEASRLGASASASASGSPVGEASTSNDATFAADDLGDEDAMAEGGTIATEAPPTNAPGERALSARAWLRRRGMTEGELLKEGQEFVAMVEGLLADAIGPATRAARGRELAELLNGAVVRGEVPASGEATPHDFSDDAPIDDIRAILEARHAGEVVLAECLRELRALHALTSRDFETFAVEHVGLSAASTRKLLSIARAAAEWSALGEAWRAGEVSSEQVVLLGRVFGRGGHDEESVERWVADARAITVRRLRDHVRLVARERALGEPAPPPPADEAWFASLHFQPGMTAARIRHLVTFAVEHESELRQRRRYFVLERDLARRFSALLRTRARWAQDQGLPHWMSLVSLLVEYALEHDRGPRRRIVERDGYRCAVPGCTSRANLDQHHIVFRSAGGGDEPENRVTLCEYHHHRGVHGDLLRVRGRAPAGLVFGVGRRGKQVRWYRADRRVLVREARP